MSPMVFRQETGPVFICWYHPHELWPRGWYFEKFAAGLYFHPTEEMPEDDFTLPRDCFESCMAKVRRMPSSMPGPTIEQVN
mmetsp:Transcript_91301/g.212378  ORF Transcript_91301/g.212378 Transcript_91301/m.212378 type:complete len:81 (-) Transcript_91301:59-301(-)